MHCGIQYLMQYALLYALNICILAKLVGDPGFASIQNIWLLCSVFVLHTDYFIVCETVWKMHTSYIKICELHFY